MADQAIPEGGPKPAPVVIKKYANRRLYNTATSAYVTLDHLSQMVKDKTDFVVYDAKTGDEITRSVLTQIIMEEENKGGQTLLPIPFLRQLISFYGVHHPRSQPAVGQPSGGLDLGVVPRERVTELANNRLPSTLTPDARVLVRL